MYGIAGIISPYTNFITRERLRTMAQPTTNDNWINDCTNTGFVLPKPNTIPICFQYLHYTIVLDGEIYNRQELRSELESKGYHFPTQHDEVLIAAAFDYWKEQCWPYLDGVFALALHDGKNNEVFIVRDRIGEKPLYYYADFRERGRFVQLMFASNMQSLWHVNAPKNRDATMLLNYITLGYTQHPNKKMATFYSDILSLPAGHYLKIISEQGRTQMRCWYRPNLVKQENISEAEALTQLDTLIDNTLFQQLESSSPIGLLWENDLNSAYVLAKANALTEKYSFAITTFSFGKQIDPTIAKQLDLSLTTNQIKDAEDYTEFLHIQDEPTADIDAFLQYKRCQLAQENGTKILLEALGADIIFGGHLRYMNTYLQYQARNNYRIFLKEKRLSESNGFIGNKNILHYLNVFSPGKIAKNKQNELHKQQNNFPFLNKDFLLRYQNEDILRQPEIHQPEDGMYFDMFTIGLDKQLRTKHQSAACFVQKLRYPFLSYKIVELLLSLPANFKFQNGYNKWLLRKSAEKVLPKDFVWQKNINEKADNTALVTFSKEQIHSALQKLVETNIFTKDCLDKPSNNDNETNWRLLNAAHFLDQNS